MISNFFFNVIIYFFKSIDALIAQIPYIDYVTPYISSSTYNFSATAASTTLKQTAAVFITHTATSSPTVTLSGSAMTYYDSTTDISGYKTSMYILKYPAATGTYVVTDVSSSSMKYISQSVWSNADIIPVFDKYTVSSGITRAYLSLPTTVVPSGLVASMYTVTGLAEYDALSNSFIQQSATSTTGDFSLLSSICSSTIDECNIGYTKPFSLFDIGNGVLIGLAMYATSSVTISSEGPPSLPTLDTCIVDVSFAGLTCLGKSLTFWFFGLFVPSENELTNMKNTFYSTITSTSSLISTVFLVPMSFALWTSTSSVPDYEQLEIYVPVFDKHFALDPDPATTTDQNAHDILTWMFGTITVLFISYKFIQLT